MGRQDRRERTALDEAYKYYRELEAGATQLDIYRLNKAVRTLSFALAVSDINEFKLTKQLWKSLHQALFDKLINSSAGRVEVYDTARKELEIRTPFPERGYLRFFPERCKRSDDTNEIEIAKLYPKTQHVIKSIWESRGAFIKPSDFEQEDCGGGICFMKPIILGQEVLGEESTRGRQNAHSRWWELYWQAYCTANKRDQEQLVKQMNDLEEIWGDLYY